MKHYLLSTLILCSLIARLSAADLDDLTYSIDGVYLTITGCDESASGELVIPRVFNNKLVVSLSYNAFRDCSLLTSVTLPNSVDTIRTEAFSNCSSLTSINVDLANPYFSSVEGVLLNRLQTTLIKCPEAKTGSFSIPTNVNTIDGFAFRDCINLTTVTIPSRVTSIGYAALQGCSSLTSIDVASANPYYSSIGGVLFNKAQTTLIQCPAGKTGAYTVPDDVISIGESAFRDCESLDTVTISDDVSSIGVYAFRICRNLTSVTIPNSVTSIGDSAFQYCLSLTEVTIPESVTSIGDSVFSSCTSLNSVIIHARITSISEKAFYNCTDLTNVTIPDSVTSIGTSAFSNCGKLTSVTLPDSVTSIENYAFSSCSSLTSLIIPDRVTNIGNQVFSNCRSLTSITIPASVTSIGDYTFLSCTSLTSAIFEGDAANSFGTSVFLNPAASFQVYFYEDATGFTTPTWEGYPSEALALNTDNDGDRFPNQLERLLGTSPLDGNSSFQMSLRHGDTGMQLHYSPHSDACQFVVESTTNLSDPDSWQVDESLTFSADSSELTVNLPMDQTGAVFYRMRISAK